MQLTVLSLLLPSLLPVLLEVRAHGDPSQWPINERLGVSGYPDCTRIHAEEDLTMEAASFDLDCSQRT